MNVQSLTQTLSSAKSQIDTANALIANGDQATDASALTNYRKAADAAETAAMLCQNVTALTGTPALAAGVQNEVAAASASDNDAGHALDRASARTAAVVGVTAASSALGYATQAVHAMASPPSRVTIAGIDWKVVGVVTVAVIGGGVWWLLHRVNTPSRTGAASRHSQSTRSEGTR